MVAINSSRFAQASTKALGNAALQRVLRRVVPERQKARAQAVGALAEPSWEQLRERAHAVKAEAIQHLDYYLDLLDRMVQRNRGQVHYAATGEQANQLVLKIAKRRGVKQVVKTKSMATEETGLTKFLSREGVETVETDLGEFILQLADEPPFHMTMPALHKSRQEISDLFQRELGAQATTDTEELSDIARRTLRDKFASAEMGVIGGNFLVAETGTVVLISNEGNGRMTTSLPRVLVALVGIEKIVPALEDLGVFLRLIAPSATGQLITSYTTFVGGPRASGEEDGPEEFHLVLLDNGRTRLLRDPELREALYCIRCGACSTACPVYGKVGGHSYGWVYSGPIGAVLTPAMTGLKRAATLPRASTLCGACREVCPVKIDIPRLLVALRRQGVESGRAGERSTSLLERQTVRLWSRAIRNREAMERSLRMVRLLLKPWQRKGWVRRVPAPMLRRWTKSRDFPSPAMQTFAELWRTELADVRP